MLTRQKRNSAWYTDPTLVIQLAVLVAIAWIPTVTWFRGDFLIWRLDFLFAPNRVQSFLRSLFFWDELGLGAANSRVLASSLPWEALRLIGQLAGSSASQNEKAIFFVYHALAGLSMYYLVTSLWPERRYRLGAFFAACFYVVNPLKTYMLVWPISPGYAVLPLKLALFARGLREGRSLRYALALVLIWVITSASDAINPVFALVDWGVLSLYLVWCLLLDRDAGHRLRAARFAVIVAVLWGALNAYWLVPAATTVRQNISGASTAPFGTSAAEVWQANTLSALDGLRLAGLWSLRADYKADAYVPWWPVYDSPGFLLIGFLMPCLAVLAILQHRKDPRILFFAILAITGLLILTGPNSPFGALWASLWQHTPLGSLFRAPLTKFGTPVLLAYSVLIGIAVATIRNRMLDLIVPTTGRPLRFRSAAWLCQAPAAVALILLVCVYSWPFWLGDYVRLSNGPVLRGERVQIPDYYYEASEWLGQSQQGFRLGIFPAALSYAFLGWRYGAGTADVSPWLFMQSVFGYEIQQTEAFRGLATPAAPPWLDLSKLLRLVNVRDFLFHNDTHWPLAEDHPWYESILPRQFRDLVRSQPGISYVREFGGDQLDLYRVDEPLARIYAAPSATVVTGDPSISLLAGTDFLDGYPAIIFSQQQHGAGATPDALIGRSGSFLMSQAGNEGSALDLTGLGSGHRIASLLVPDMNARAGNAFYVPAPGAYQIRARIAPDVRGTRIYLLPQQTDWKAELGGATWQMLPRTPSSLAQPPEGAEPPFTLLGSGWYGEEHDQQARWRWGENDMVLMVVNPTPENLQSSLAFRASTIQPRDLDISVNGQAVDTVHLRANYDRVGRLPLVDALRERIYARPVYPFPYESRIPRDWQTVTLQGIILHPGVNEVRLRTPQGADIMDGLLGNGDRRKVSIQLWGDVKLAAQSPSAGEQRQAPGSSRTTTYETDFVGGQLALNMRLDGNNQQPEHVVMSRDFASVNLEEYPFFRFRYRVNDPSVATVDAVFGIDYTADGQVDDYIVASSVSVDRGNSQQIAFNIFEAAKDRYAGPYYKDRRDLRLVRVYLIPHKRWDWDFATGTRLCEFRFGDFNFYNDRSLIVPTHETLASKPARVGLQSIANAGALGEAHSSGDAYRRLPYPADTALSQEQKNDIASSFSLPLMKIDGRPASFQPPVAQINLLDKMGYWSDPITLTLAAGRHELELTPHPTFQADLVEIANRPYEPQEAMAGLTFRKVNPTRYNVGVDAAKGFWLVFSESFDPGWQAYIVTDRSVSDHPWYEWSALLTSLAERGRRVALPDHYLVNAYANGWYVPDTGKYAITLEFTPQRQFEAGVVISLSALLVCIGYLLWRRLHKWQQP